MIKNVIFDIGNVLMRFLPLRYLNDRYQAELADRINRTIFASKEWGMLDEGSIAFEEAERRFTERQPDIAEELRDVLYNWCSIMEPMEETIALLEELKRSGYRIYYLSNMPSIGRDFILENCAFLEHFDGGIFSCDERLVKPGSKIFELLLSRYRLRPKECLFLDDMEQNIETAKELGFETILFDGDTQIVRERLDGLKGA